MNKALVITAIAIVSLVLGLLLQGIGMWRVSQKWGESGKGWTLSLLSIAYIFVIVGIVMVVVSMIMNKVGKKATTITTKSATGKKDNYTEMINMASDVMKSKGGNETTTTPVSNNTEFLTMLSEAADKN